MADVEAVIARGSGPRRAEMLRRVTDLFIGHCPQYSDDEIALFDDVISLLAGEIETAARVTLAAQLAPIPNAPQKIINRLANDDAIEVAWPVLAHSERVDENALIESAMMQSQQHLLAICKRRAIGERVTDVMIARGERQVLAGHRRQSRRAHFRTRLRDAGPAQRRRRRADRARRLAHRHSASAVPQAAHQGLAGGAPQAQCRASACAAACRGGGDAGDRRDPGRLARGIVALRRRRGAGHLAAPRRAIARRRCQPLRR